MALPHVYAWYKRCGRLLRHWGQIARTLIYDDATPMARRASKTARMPRSTLRTAYLAA